VKGSCARFLGKGRAGSRSPRYQPRWMQRKARPVLMIIARDVAAVPAIARSLPRTLSVRTWKDLATLYVQVSTILGRFLTVIRAITLPVTLFIHANSMNRTVLERMPEWGTLRALGTKEATSSW